MGIKIRSEEQQDLRQTYLNYIDLKETRKKEEVNLYAFHVEFQKSRNTQLS